MMISIDPRIDASAVHADAATPEHEGSRESQDINEILWRGPENIRWRPRVAIVALAASKAPAALSNIVSQGSRFSCRKFHAFVFADISIFATSKTVR